MTAMPSGFIAVANATARSRRTCLGLVQQLECRLLAVLFADATGAGTPARLIEDPLGLIGAVGGVRPDRRRRCTRPRSGCSPGDPAPPRTSRISASRSTPTFIANRAAGSAVNALPAGRVTRASRPTWLSRSRHRPVCRCSRRVSAAGWPRPPHRRRRAGRGVVVWGVGVNDPCELRLLAPVVVAGLQHRLIGVEDFSTYGPVPTGALLSVQLATGSGCTFSDGTMPSSRYGDGSASVPS